MPNCRYDSKHQTEDESLNAKLKKNMMALNVILNNDGSECQTKKLITSNTKNEAPNAQTELTALNARNVALNTENVAMNARS